VYFSSLFAGFLTVAGSSLALAQPPAAKPSAPTPASPAAPAAATTTKSSIPLASSGAASTLAVPGKSLMAARLHVASFPKEAEIRCSLSDSCAFGLTKGFVIGSDFVGTGVTTLLGQHLIKGKGSWVFYDGFVGYQFLGDKDSRSFANGSVGYRGYSVTKDIGIDDEERTLKTNGFVFRINYAQEITSTYSQGLTFQMFSGKTKMNGPDNLRSINDESEGSKQRSMVRSFYEYSLNYPTIRVALPADFEVINWRASHIDLPNHLRGYARFEPFYIQNELIIDDRIDYIEKNFGARLMALLAYESPAEKAGRFALLGGLGADIAGSNKPEAKYPNDDLPTQQVRNEEPNPRDVFRLLPYWFHIEAAYQF
jgi:hypothetical protein